MVEAVTIERVDRQERERDEEQGIIEIPFPKNNVPQISGHVADSGNHLLEG